MDLELSEEQEFVRETARRFLDRDMSSGAVRKLADRAMGFERSWWRLGAEVALEIAGARAAVWHEGDPTATTGIGAIARQQAGIGGGTLEMAMNAISEQLLGMPREPAADRGVPFDRVRHDTAPRSKG